MWDKNDKRIIRTRRYIMPGFDGTGPLGEGPMTGGGFGYCTPTGTRRFSQGRFPFGRRAFGRGRGFRNRFFRANQPAMENLSPENEKQYLEDELKCLEKEIETIKERIKEFKNT
jgi:hypothetical protein